MRRIIMIVTMRPDRPTKLEDKLCCTALHWQSWTLWMISLLSRLALLISSMGRKLTTTQVWVNILWSVVLWLVGRLGHVSSKIF